MASAIVALAATAAQAAPPGVQTADFGTTETGQRVHVFTLTNRHGVTAKVLDLGGTILEINVPDRRGVRANVVLRMKGLADYRAVATMNALVGRFANRLKNGLTLDGRHYDLTANPLGVTLHGGRDPWGARLWTAEPAGDGARLSLSLVSPDGDQGFPGQVRVKVIYTLTDDDALRLDYEATTDKPTVLNLTNHLYFNLAGDGTVENHRLRLAADAFTPVTEDLVPTGEIAPVAGTALDFRRPRRIGDRIRSSEPQMLLAHGYDHNFVLRKAPGDPLQLAAWLYDPASGRILELSTTEPGLQVYSSNFMTGQLVRAVGSTIRQGDALALETQHFPNSPAIPAFPSTTLRPGETFRSTTIYRFTTDKGRRLR